MGTAKWLHAILHQTGEDRFLCLRSNPCIQGAERGAEGDLEKNAKLWYQEVDPDVLRIYWQRYNPSDPCKAAIDNMYTIMRVKGNKSQQGDEEKVRRVKWDELCCVMAELERRHGWEEMDAREVYTPEDHPSMVLGTSLALSLIRC